MCAWSRDWMNYLNIGPDDGQLKVFPLQFANCDRLEHNDAVYIFDEVGSGKTITAGLMALHYLYHYKDDPLKKVLVITVNALVKPCIDSSEGQFKADWKKLPFTELGFEKRIKVINNHYSNIKKKQGEWGLVIIDEAHKFLNMENKRDKMLCGDRADEASGEGPSFLKLQKQVTAEKVVFLTATPARVKEDLKTYACIARYLIPGQNNISEDWIKDICTGDYSKETDGTEGNGSIGPQDLICSRFDKNYPVTRYFKDTVRALRLVKTDQTPPRRLLPDVWEYKNKHEAVREGMLKYLQGNDRDGGQFERDRRKDRFVIFVRYVKREAKELEKYLLDNGFIRYEASEKHSPDTMTVAVVTGQNSWELASFKSTEPEALPTALILTYQVAEQGVNLPGFNHVINYHIPAYPSSLEQRYGRVDRLNSKSTEIFIHFLVSGTSSPDSDSLNFQLAVSMYIRSFLPCLPAKNTILTEKILDRYLSRGDTFHKYAEQIRELAQKENLLRIIAHAAGQGNTGSEDDLAKLADLEEFIEQHVELELSGPFNKRGDAEEFAEKLQKDINEHLKKYDKDKNLSKEVIETVKYILGKAEGNKIFYLKEDISREKPWKEAVAEDLDTVDAAECAKWILGDQKSAFQSYRDELHEKIWPSRLFSDCMTDLEQAYEELFQENRLEEIFTFPAEAKNNLVWSDAIPKEAAALNQNTVKKLCEKIVDKYLEHDSSISRDLAEKYLLQSLQLRWQELPLFRLCNLFGEELQKHQCYKDTGKLRIKYMKDPLIESFESLKKPAEDLSLSKVFIQMYWGNPGAGRFFTFIEKDGEVKASVWYRLAYQYTGRHRGTIDLLEERYCKVLGAAYHVHGKTVQPNPRSLFEHFFYKLYEGEYRKNNYKDEYCCLLPQKGSIKLPTAKDDLWTTGILDELKLKDL